MHKELDWHLEEQFINGLNDDGMIVIIKITCELLSLSDISFVTSQQVFARARRVEAQWDLKSYIKQSQRNRDLEAVRSHNQSQNLSRGKNHQKSRITSHYLSKTKSANIADPITILSSVLPMGKCVGDVQIESLPSSVQEKWEQKEAHFI